MSVSISLMVIAVQQRLMRQTKPRSCGSTPRRHSACFRTVKNMRFGRIELAKKKGENKNPWQSCERAAAQVRPKELFYLQLLQPVSAEGVRSFPAVSIKLYRLRSEQEDCSNKPRTSQGHHLTGSEHGLRPR